MSSLQIFIIIFFSIIIFYGLIIWFLHKASVYFHKMDERVGNVERAENISVYKDCVIIRENIPDKKKQKEEKKIIKEEQQIY
jgi:hypothetical protein